MMQRAVIRSVRVDDEHIGLWTLLGVSVDVILDAAGFDIKTETLSA